MFTRPPAPTPPASPATRLPPISFANDDDDSIPEDALEFNPAAADVNQVFVEPPPNPEWTAATGTFKSIILKSEEAAQSTEIELDPDFLSSTAEMRKLQMGLGEPDPAAARPTPDGNNITGNAVGRGGDAQSTPRAPAQPPPARAPAPGAQPPAPAAGPTPQGTAHRSAPARNPPPDSQPQVHPFLSETQSQPRQRSATGETQSQPRLRPSSADTQSQPHLRLPEELQSHEHSRASPADTQPHHAPSEQNEPPPPARAQPHKTIRAFGLDSVEPAPDRLAALARARIAPGSSEPPMPRGLLEMLTNSPAAWTAGAGVLVVLLVAQMVNHYRNDLAATTTFNKPITALYSALGVRLTPRWDLRVYDVRQLGASVDAANAGQIMVRASVKNGGHQAQPLPLLRVTLQDRFGNRIAARDVAPGNYLPRAIPATSFLAAGQRIDAEMAFVDPGSNAVGFEIDACLPAPAGGLACANDPAP